MTKSARQPVVRISKGRFAPEMYTDVVPSSELLDRARGLATQISKVSRQSVAALKCVVAASTNLAPTAISVLEEETFAGLFGTSDQRSRMRTFLANQAAQPISR
jgi:enoyl-CoA hydratase/carnithine racemase